ncbi:MAG: hypothetical protein M1814_005114 [Vezdaea aestivalis]|nr:MAG: hypothetical protein M1814_005114 [Vezdaea aestivalis]
MPPPPHFESDRTLRYPSFSNFSDSLSAAPSISDSEQVHPDLDRMFMPRDVSTDSYSDMFEESKDWFQDTIVDGWHTKYDSVPNGVQIPRPIHRKRPRHDWFTVPGSSLHPACPMKPILSLEAAPGQSADVFRTKLPIPHQIRPPPRALLWPSSTAVARDAPAVKTWPEQEVDERSWWPCFRRQIREEKMKRLGTFEYHPSRGWLEVVQRPLNTFQKPSRRCSIFARRKIVA